MPQEARPAQRNPSKAHGECGCHGFTKRHLERPLRWEEIEGQNCRKRGWPTIKGKCSRWPAMARQRPRSRSDRLQTGKESLALNDLRKAGESWPDRQRYCHAGGHNQDENFLCCYWRSELRSVGNKRHCLAVSARAEDNHPWRQQGMAGACGKVLSSGHKLKGGARGGPWEQRGALHEAYWPLCFTSVFLQKACQDELMFHCFWFLLLWTLYSHCPHIGSANPGFGAWETKSVKNEWLPDSGLARLVNTAATFVCWSGDLCLVCTLCCGSKFTPHLWIFPRIYFLVHCSTTTRPGPLEAVNLGHSSGLLRPWGLPRVASVICVQGNGWSLFSNRVYIFTFNAH